MKNKIDVVLVTSAAIAVGMSTQKLHARGPMGLKEMTTYKYKIYGNGEVR